jgi:hypothetical protein
LRHFVVKPVLQERRTGFYELSWSWRGALFQLDALDAPPPWGSTLGGVREGRATCTPFAGSITAPPSSTATPWDKGVQVAHPFPDLSLCLQSWTGQDVKESPFRACFVRFRGESRSSWFANLITQTRRLLEGLASTWVTCLIRRTTMRMDPTRKCSNCTDVEKFGVFGHSNFRKHSHFREHSNSRKHSYFPLPVK